MSEFVVETLRPAVVTLDRESHTRLVGGRAEDEIWLGEAGTSA